MIDWLTILLALAIITTLVVIFGFVAWKINMSDPLDSYPYRKKDENTPQIDSTGDKRKKDKSGSELRGKKRKDQRKTKRESKTDDFERHHNVRFAEAAQESSEDTDNEREESEQEASPPTPPVSLDEVSTKSRKRNKNKAARQTTPPPPLIRTSARTEGILINKNEKSPITANSQPIPHPKFETMIPKDEVEIAKQHNQQTQNQPKPAQLVNKQTVAASSGAAKKSTASINNNNQDAQRKQEQPFTTVVNNRHKGATPPLQQQQNNKVVVAPPSPSTLLTSPAQQQPNNTIQSEALPQRQTARPQQASIQVNGFGMNQPQVKQATSNASVTPKPQLKVAEIIKALPTSQAVVTELMLALDAYPLSVDELNIVMHKIANKQAVIKQDWTKLQHGQKVDPQAHIGQVMDESVRAYEADVKTNAMKRIKDLTEELNNEKRRINDLLKEKSDKELSIQILRTQLDTIHHQQPATQMNAQQQHQLQTLQLQLQRLTEDNIQLNQRLMQQQQQLPLISHANNSDATHPQVQVMTVELRRLAMENSNWEKKVQANEEIMKKAQEANDNLHRSNQKLVQDIQDIQKQLQTKDDKLVQELNETRTKQLSQKAEFERRIVQLEADLEKLRREEIVRSEAAADLAAHNFTSEDREKMERDINQLKQTIDSLQQRMKEQEQHDEQVNAQLINERDQYKRIIEDIRIQYQSKENDLRQEFERLQKENNATSRQQDESFQREITGKTAQIEALQLEIETLKAQNDEANGQSDQRLRQQQGQYKQLLLNILSHDARQSLLDQNQDFEQWLSSYQQKLQLNIESEMKILQDESAALKLENGRLHQNMSDIESQLREIEQTVQTKEEVLLSELKNKDNILERMQDDNEQLNSEVQRLRQEIDRVQRSNSASLNEIQTLKQRLEERPLLVNNNPPNIADELFEFIRQSSPPEIDARAEELNELIRASKEALANQDSIVQELDKCIDGLQPGVLGEASTFDVDQSVDASNNQESEQKSDS